MVKVTSTRHIKLFYFFKVRNTSINYVLQKLRIIRGNNFNTFQEARKWRGELRQDNDVFHYKQINIPCFLKPHVCISLIKHIFLITKKGFKRGGRVSELDSTLTVVFSVSLSPVTWQILESQNNGAPKVSYLICSTCDVILNVAKVTTQCREIILSWLLQKKCNMRKAQPTLAGL